MYNLWPLLIISFAFLLIIFIIFRHFPALALLDVENISEEKERRIKEKIIKERMRRKFKFLNNFFQKISDWFNKISNIFWSKLEAWKDKKKEERRARNLAEVSDAEKVKMIFSLAKTFIDQEDWLEAEKKLIEIISLDDKNFLAFLELGKVYQAQEKWQEAKQTLLYALKLAKLFPEQANLNDFSNINYSLAIINQELGDLDLALKSLERALENDPNNPRYLDLMLNLCIMKRDKGAAIKYLEKIKKSNPQNNNIAEWSKDIEKI